MKNVKKSVDMSLGTTHMTYVHPPKHTHAVRYVFKQEELRIHEADQSQPDQLLLSVCHSDTHSTWSAM